MADQEGKWEQLYEEEKAEKEQINQEHLEAEETWKELETELETSWKLNQYLTPCPVYVRAKETAPGRTPAQPPGSLDMVGRPRRP